MDCQFFKEGLFFSHAWLSKGRQYNTVVRYMDTRISGQGVALLTRKMTFPELFHDLPKFLLLHL